MNSQQPFRAFLICLIACGAATVTQAKAPPGDQEPRMLMHLLTMSNDELARARETIERIEALSPEERKEMRQRLSKFQKMDSERREAHRKRFQSISKEEREAMRQRWFDMSPEERIEWRKKLRDMSAEERLDAFKEQGFLPSQAKHATASPEEAGKGPPPPQR